MWLDADAGVGDADFHAAVRIGIGGGNCDGAALGGELDRVFHEIPEDLLQTCGVGVYRAARSRQRYGCREALAAQVALADLQDMPDGFVKVGRLQVEFEFAAADAHQVEQIINQANFELHVAADHFDELAQMGRQVGRRAPALARRSARG